MTICIEIVTELFSNFSNIIIDNDGNKWFSDNYTGLIKKSEPFDLQIVPDGPNSNNAYKIKASENYLNNQAICVLAQDDIAANEHLIQTGDIIALATSMY